MSTVSEIEDALPKLSPEELAKVEAAIRRVQRERGVGIIYDDAYGIWTNEDQSSVAAEAWRMMDA
ncbi:MAG TPA: hypothetical protein VGM54_17555 [Chthoniobacter sp.]|jgi:hypothetical protein